MMNLLNVTFCIGGLIFYIIAFKPLFENPKRQMRQRFYTIGASCLLMQSLVILHQSNDNWPLIAVLINALALTLGIIGIKRENQKRNSIDL